MAVAGRTRGSYVTGRCFHQSGCEHARAPEWWRGLWLHEGRFSTVGRAGRLSVHTLGTCPWCEGRNQSFLHAPPISTTESETLRVLSVNFLTRKNCHLCDEARAVLDEITADIGLRVNEIDIDSDDELVKLWGLRVPVVLATHDRVIAEGIIDDKRALRDQIQKVLSS